MSTTIPKRERCRICGARLSLHNDDILCFPCQEKEEELEITYWERLKMGKVLKITEHEPDPSRPNPSGPEFFSYLRAWQLFHSNKTQESNKNINIE
jgi:hypothetical protein